MGALRDQTAFNIRERAGRRKQLLPASRLVVRSVARLNAALEGHSEIQRELSEGGTAARLPPAATLGGRQRGKVVLEPVPRLNADAPVKALLEVNRPGELRIHLRGYCVIGPQVDPRVTSSPGQERLDQARERKLEEYEDDTQNPVRDRIVGGASSPKSTWS